MDRRSFLQKTFVLSGALAIKTPLWVTGEKCRFGYYYPTEYQPQSITIFTEMLQHAGINVELTNLIGQDPAVLVKQLQQGYFAGIFLSNNVIYSQLEDLKCLADGPDFEEQAALNEVAANAGNFDKLLFKHNLKRVPFVSVGHRRGIWINKKWNLNADLSGAKVFADGKWADHFAQRGSKVVYKFENPAEIDIFVLSNLYAAEQMKFYEIADLYSFDEARNAQLKSANFDLFMNIHFWDTLADQTKDNVKVYVAELGEKVSNFLKIQDAQLASKFVSNERVVGSVPALRSLFGT
jgi:hypothetical protein